MEIQIRHDYSVHFYDKQVESEKERQVTLTRSLQFAGICNKVWNKLGGAPGST